MFPDEGTKLFVQTKRLRHVFPFDGASQGNQSGQPQLSVFLMSSFQPIFHPFPRAPLAASFRFLLLLFETFHASVDVRALESRGVDGFHNFDEGFEPAFGSSPSQPKVIRDDEEQGLEEHHVAEIPDVRMQHFGTGRVDVKILGGEKNAVQ